MMTTNGHHDDNGVSLARGEFAGWRVNRKCSHTAPSHHFLSSVLSNMSRECANIASHFSFITCQASCTRILLTVKELKDRPAGEHLMFHGPLDYQRLIKKIRIPKSTMFLPSPYVHCSINNWCFHHISDKEKKV